MTTRIILSVILQSIVMLFVPIVGQLVSQSTLGYSILMLASFFQGLFATVLQSSAVAFGSVFHRDQYLGLYFTGTGLAGLLVTVCNLFLSLVIPDSDHKSFVATMIYFVVSIVFLFISLLYYIRFRRTNYCRYYINLSRNKSVEQNPSWIQTIVQDEPLEIKEEQMDEKLVTEIQKSLQEEKLEKTPEDRAGLRFIFFVFKKLQPMPFNAWLIYVQTFMLFPGVAMIHSPIFGLSNEISWTIQLIVFNVFDTVGKYLPNMIFLNVRKASLLVWVRFLFYFTMVYMIFPSAEAPYIHSDVFCLFNMALFALTNGWATSANMILAPMQAEGHEKETAGFLMTFPLTFGILCGTMLANVFKHLG